ncbi:MAG: LysM peptidoglycan-binding domain-containing protein [Streptococcaceae bacterium]|jgi:cytoskeletal protein RodZ|nr:LysM peptidoglycan-binding domain-containing protein [Streptococcaceae bacterium]
MAKKNEPWNNEIYGAMQESRNDLPPRRAGKEAEASTNFLTFLVVLLFVIIGGIVVMIVWNNRLVDNTKISTSFYTSKSSLAKSTVSSSAATSEKPAESSTSVASSTATGETTTVIAGEGLYSIAARTGVAAETIAKANGMTVQNWYANPGDVIKLK